MKRKVGLSVGSGKKGVSREHFAAYLAAGIEAVELSLGGLCLNDAYRAFDFKGIAADARAEGVEPWSLHLPFAPFEEVNIASLDEGIRKRTVDGLSEIIRRTGDAGISLAVIHPSAEPNEEKDRPRHLMQAKASLARLSEVCRQNGVTLAVEDLPRSCLGNSSAELLELISVDPSLRVCFDTNHLLFEDPVHFVRALGDKIVTVHVSDYDFVNERHWLPGEGKADFYAILSALDEVGYRGPWLYEVGLETPKSIERERELTLSDFAKNANEIFSFKPLTVLGKPLV